MCERSEPQSYPVNNPVELTACNPVVYRKVCADSILIRAAAHFYVENQIISMKRNLSLATLLLLVTLLLGLTNVVFSSEVFPRIYPDTYSLDNPLMYIFVATVEQKIPNHDKNTGPEDFTGVLNVTEIIRGHNIDFGRITARWNLKDNQVRVARHQPPQNPRPLKMGDKIIVFSWLDDNKVAVVNYLYEYTDENRRRVLTHMAQPEWAPNIKLLLFLLILIFPILGLIILVLFYTLKTDSRRMRSLYLFSIVAPILTLVTYFIYEMGISTYSNIRIDLLIIWPVVGGSFILWLIPIFVKIRRHQKHEESPTNR